VATGSYNKFPQSAAALHHAISQVVRKIAFDVQASAQANAPVDTGFLRNSIYTVTSEGSGRAQVGAPTKADSYLFPEIAAPPDDTTAYVAIGANYGEFVEMGTRYTPAQPFVTPAVELARGDFEAELGAIEPGMKAEMGL
jgi:HK97 gp10 family phage protein